MTLHYKKDGTLDMRFNSSRAAVSSGFGMSSFRYSEDVSYSPMPAELHYKKDRTLDMRYNSSKALATSCHVSRPATSSQLHYKKDSTLDMRYTSSKNVMTSSKSGYTYSGHDMPRNIPVTKAGIPDMRTTAAKEWVKEQARMGMNDIPSWIPRTKDNSLDLTKAVTQEYLKCKDTISTNCVPDQRLAYYCQKLEDMLFRKLIEDAPRDHVDMPEYEILPETNEIQRQLSSRSIRSSIRYDDDDYDIPSEISESVTLINYRDLKINSEDKLGQGSFGIVYKGIWKNQTIAVKQSHLNKLTRQEKNSFVKEIKIMSTLGEHPNLVHSHGYTLDPLCLVMEYVELAKVTDFGLATLRAKTSSSIASSMTSDDGATICGTAGYMAPELLSSTKPPEYSSDVYSFGILLNEVIHEEEPYSDQYLNFAGREAFGAANYAQSGKRPNIKLGTPPCLKNLIEKCWHAYAQGRPSFKQIYQDLKPDHIKFPNSIDL
ncbi:unnamed protein product [Rotaria sordida]|uniref:Protein kinase domain-containing protein n=1 Tax=Rotaria sordida TaxID=392033 RepID=A0A819F670_9BILA|nr:unnamed protein product [Rotaria sordida]